MRKPTIVRILVAAAVTCSVVTTSPGTSMTVPIIAPIAVAMTIEPPVIATITALLISVPELSQTAEASGNPPSHGAHAWQGAYPYQGSSASLSVAQVPTASEIIRKMEQNTDFKTAYYEAKMEITQRERVNTKTMRAWVEGNNRALVEFTNKRDLGTRILKVGDDLWLFSPTAEEEVRLSGEMLNQGMMGSDFSYQDALESTQLLELYESRVIGVETRGDRQCYVLELVAREGIKVSYYRRKIWVDTERYLGLREELYAPSGRLLKQSSTESIEKIGNRYYPMLIVMEDATRKGSSTKFIIESIVFDKPIPADTFTRQRLTSR
jgi:outer membrane lipoprotein-sorting protein